MKESIIILSGKRNPSIVANNIYLNRLNAQYNLIFVEEQRKRKQTIQYFKRHLQKMGFVRTLDIICCRLYFIALNLFNRKTKKGLKKQYPLSLVTSDVNAPCVLALAKKYHPKYVIANGCGILSKSAIRDISCPILNVHIGIAPRYRGGTGNVWASYEKNFALVGSTVHYIDEGVDTGERISVMPIDIRKDNLPIEENAIISIKAGAHLLVDFILHQKKEIPAEYQNLSSRHYPLPGLTHYLKAKRNYSNYLKN